MRLDPIDELASLLGRPAPPPDPTGLPLVAFAGGTGSGKSSLVNAIAGGEVSPVGRLRPTTSEVVAVFPGAQSPVPALDALGVIEHRSGSHEGVILLDLPDLDSVVEGHRRLAEAAMAQAAAIVWVLDPEKYADASVHQSMQALADTPSIVVCNQVDRLAGHERQEILGHLTDLVAGRPVAATAVPLGGEPVGIDRLTQFLSGVELPLVSPARRRTATGMLEDVGPSPDPGAEIAWAAAEDGAARFVDEVRAGASNRLRASGPRLALGLRARHDEAAPATPSIEAPPASWGSDGPPDVVTGWGPAAERLAEGCDAASIMTASAAVRRGGWWAPARWSALALAVGVGIAVLAGALSPWALAVAAGVVGAVIVALVVSGRGAGRRAAGSLDHEVSAAWDGVVGSDTVHRQRAAAGAADRVHRVADAVRSHLGTQPLDT